VHTQQNYRIKYGKDQPSHLSIPIWQKKFMEAEIVLNKGRSRRQKTSIM